MKHALPTKGCINKRQNVALASVDVLFVPKKYIFLCFMVCFLIQTIWNKSFIIGEMQAPMVQRDLWPKWGCQKPFKNHKPSKNESFWEKKMVRKGSPEKWRANLSEYFVGCIWWPWHKTVVSITDLMGTQWIFPPVSVTKWSINRRYYCSEVSQTPAVGEGGGGPRELPGVLAAIHVAIAAVASRTLGRAHHPALPGRHRQDGYPPLEVCAVHTEGVPAGREGRGGATAGAQWGMGRTGWLWLQSGSGWIVGKPYLEAERGGGNFVAILVFRFCRILQIFE